MLWKKYIYNSCERIRVMSWWDCVALRTIPISLKSFWKKSVGFKVVIIKNNRLRSAEKFQYSRKCIYKSGYQEPSYQVATVSLSLCYMELLGVAQDRISYSVNPSGPCVSLTILLKSFLWKGWCPDICILVKHPNVDIKMLFYLNNWTFLIFWFCLW